MKDKLRQFGLGLLGALGAACVLTVAPASNALAASPSTGPIITTTGVYEGFASPFATDDPTGVNGFFGIRYATAPEGTLRWQPPTAPTMLQGTTTSPYLAEFAGNACPQGPARPATDNEDCLFLNVFVPASAKPKSKLPVWLWIHGGALVAGDGASFDPAQMVLDNDIIVVTINYRLGALGWLAESGLDATTANAFQKVGDSGDYGMMDQQFAMQWVQSNIAAFGGDPNKVTIGGESAGGLSVSINLASPTAHHLFRGVIIESGAFMFHNLQSQASWESAGLDFDAAVGCTPGDASCLRGLSVAQILTGQDASFGKHVQPDFDTKILPKSLRNAFSSGDFNLVPALQGTNANEGRFFEPGDIETLFNLASPLPMNVTKAGGPANFELSNPNTVCGALESPPTSMADCTYAQEVGAFLGALGPHLDTPSLVSLLESEYPMADFPDPDAHGAPNADEALSQIFTDLNFACNALDANRDLAKFVSVYAYEFNDRKAPPGNVNGFPTASEHTAELQFLFNMGSTLDAGEVQLATQMQTYWANFVKTLDPNLGTSSGSVPSWPVFNDGKDIQKLVPGPHYPHPFFTFYDEHFCSTWDPILEAE